MNQDQINQAEWENPENWSGPRAFAAYFSKRDSRTVVPKRLTWMGWTVNLGTTAGSSGSWPCSSASRCW
jgi:uncharacterized membrane protein